MRATILLASVLVFTSVEPAAASPRQEAAPAPAFEVLSISDLNLAAARDQKRLRIRIASAANRLCSDEFSAAAWLPAVEMECFHDAATDALAQMQVLIARAGSGPAVAAIPSSISVRAVRR